MTTVKKYRGYDVPEGATHVSREGVLFYCKYDDGWCYWSQPSNSWCQSINDKPFDNTNCLPLPQAPVAYMPKVGEECEVQKFDQHTTGSWEKCFVVGETQDKTSLVIHDDHDVLHFICKEWNSVKFRHIKTEREQVIEWASNEVEAMHYKDGLGKLYDIGALTIPGGVSNERN